MKYIIEIKGHGRSKYRKVVQVRGNKLKEIKEKGITQLYNTKEEAEKDL